MANKLLPVCALFADMLLTAKMNAGALAAFEASAKLKPNRFRQAVLPLARSAGGTPGHGGFGIGRAA